MRYKGALDIIRFNLPAYLVAIVLIFVSSALIVTSSNGILKIAFVCIFAISCFWFVSSIIASHWIYDRCPLSRWMWLSQCFPSSPEKWLSIHAGFDETVSLRKFFQDDQGISVDIFDARIMTESSIVRARKTMKRSLPSIRTGLALFPFRENSIDAAFLIFCFHEVRSAEARSRLLIELNRILKPGGSLIVLEHGRNLANFAAFGPGCFHFLPYSVWFELADKAGLHFRNEIRFTPFVKALFFKVEKEAMHAA